MKMSLAMHPFSSSLRNVQTPTQNTNFKINSVVDTTSSVSHPSRTEANSVKYRVPRTATRFIKPVQTSLLA